MKVLRSKKLEGMGSYQMDIDLESLKLNSGNYTIRSVSNSKNEVLQEVIIP